MDLNHTRARVRLAAEMIAGAVAITFHTNFALTLPPLPVSGRMVKRRARLASAEVKQLDSNLFNFLAIVKAAFLAKIDDD
jgi:hypothetical protein